MCHSEWIQIRNRFIQEVPKHQEQVTFPILQQQQQTCLSLCMLHLWTEKIAKAEVILEFCAALNLCLFCSQSGCLDLKELERREGICAARLISITHVHFGVKEGTSSTLFMLWSFFHHWIS